MNPNYKPDECHQEQIENFKRIERYLNTQDKAKLIELIFDFLAHDQELLELIDYV